MAKSNSPTPQVDEAVNTARAIFSTNPAFGPQARHFWQAQDRLLSEAERFSSAWFKRRHDAAQAAIATTRQIADGGAQDPAAALRAITDWQAHSLERLAKDARDCTEMMARCADALLRNEVEALEETADNTRRATSSSQSEPV